MSEVETLVGFIFVLSLLLADVISTNWRIDLLKDEIEELKNGKK